MQRLCALILLTLVSNSALPHGVNNLHRHLKPNAAPASVPAVPAPAPPAATNAVGFAFSDSSLITWGGITGATTINVSGVVGNVIDVNITLNELAVQNAFLGVSEFDILLVPPSGPANDVMLMSFACSNTSGPITVTFDMSATGVMPAGSSGQACISASYLPSDYGPLAGSGYILDAPAPPPPYSTDLGILNGLDPNGVWTLYFEEFAGDEGGQLGSGWSIQITTDADTQSIPALNVYGLAVFIGLLGLIGYWRQRLPKQMS